MLSVILFQININRLGGDSHRDQGAHLVGLYCGYAPVELIRAMDAVPVSLCASSRQTISATEAVLPANLCPDSLK